VHGVVARAVRALQVCLPRFAAAADEVPDVRCVDVIERVFLFGVGERDAERAAAGEREVIGVARVLFRVEVRQGRATAPEAIQVRGLLGVADDLISAAVA
jgi:hypothetical protein